MLQFAARARNLGNDVMLCHGLPHVHATWVMMSCFVTVCRTCTQPAYDVIHTQCGGPHGLDVRRTCTRPASTNIQVTTMSCFVTACRPHAVRCLFATFVLPCACLVHVVVCKLPCACCHARVAMSTRSHAYCRSCPCTQYSCWCHAGPCAQCVCDYTWFHKVTIDHEC